MSLKWQGACSSLCTLRILIEEKKNATEVAEMISDALGENAVSHSTSSILMPKVSERRFRSRE